MSADISRLKTQLLTSGLQKSNNPLYQIINQLIDALSGAISPNTGTVIIDLTTIKNRTFWTELNELSTLPLSRRVLAGFGISLDYSTAGQVTVNASSGIQSVGYWTPLTDGDVDETDLIFANGDAIAVFVPTP